MYLRQSTASQEILLGYFLDSVDGNTEETGLTIANTDIKLHKAGATTLANKNSGGATHISNGLYYTVLDATDTDTLGNLVVSVHVSGALPVKATYTVLAANVYDSLVAGSDLLQVDTTQISGDGTAADNLELQYDGTGLTGDTFPATQLAADTILADTNELQTNQGNWLTATGFSTHTAGDVVTAMQAVADDFKADVSGLLTSAAYTAPDNSSIAAILVDTGTTIPASLSAIAGYIDTEVSAIKAKTDSLTFTVSGQVDSNITYVNDVEVGGTGTDVDPWNPA